MQGIRAFARLLDFKGRSGRAEYWQFFGIVLAGLLVAATLDYLADPFSTGRLQRIVAFGTMLPHAAVATRRLHDRGRSGWWVAAYIAVAATAYPVIFAMQAAQTASSYDAWSVLLGILFIVLVGLGLFLLVQLLLPGDDFTNNYGPVDDLDRTLAESARPAPRYPGMDAGRSRAPTPTAPPTSAMMAPAHDGDPLDRIERLAKLRDSGVLTDEEFGVQKAALLKRL